MGNQKQFKVKRQKNKQTNKKTTHRQTWDTANKGHRKIAALNGFI